MTPTRKRIQLGTPQFLPKICIHCHESYIPTSGRQLVCQQEECRRWKTRNYPSRKNGRYFKRGERPTQKKCEWEDCRTTLNVRSTGLVPKYCDEHQQRADNIYSIKARKEWSRRTIDVECVYPDCVELQHPRATGWCYKHYPIWSVHGVDGDKWWEMFNVQNGLCPICEQLLFDGRIVVIDHDHKKTSSPRHTVEHVRGLLHS